MSDFPRVSEQTRIGQSGVVLMVLMAIALVVPHPALSAHGTTLAGFMLLGVGVALTDAYHVAQREDSDA